MCSSLSTPSQRMPHRMGQVLRGASCCGALGLALLLALLGRCVGHQLVDLGVLEHPEANLSRRGLLDHSELQLFCGRVGGVHRFHEHLRSQLKSLLRLQAWLPILPHDLLRGVVVNANRICLPTAEIPGWVRVVELEALRIVVAGDKEGHAEGTQAAKLSVALLEVADGCDQLLNWHGLAIGVNILGSAQAELVDQDVRIRGDAGNGTKHVGVELEELLMLLSLVQQLRGGLLFTCEHDAVFRQDTDRRSG
mmetsp:Transcript_73292/g.164685  ORF Transcript_73292/g.164685 Transcript_73292/m.164685 type:complete len:251 (+) Transcript_73292:67-819(+)